MDCHTEDSDGGGDQLQVLGVFHVNSELELMDIGTKMEELDLAFVTVLYAFFLVCFCLTCTSVCLCNSPTCPGRSDPTGKGRNYVELQVMETPCPLGSRSQGFA